MKKIFLKGLLLIIVNTCMIACSKQSEDKLKQNSSGCDTTDISFANDVLPIIKANCYSCHGNGEADGDISLDGYSNLKLRANSGDLEGTVKYLDGYPPMPEGSAKLSDCDINIITAWIKSGAPNN